MLKNWWIIGAIPLLAIMSVSTIYLFTQKDAGVNPRAPIHSAIANYGPLPERGIGQVEILSDRDIRFLISGGANNKTQTKEVLDQNLKEFCSLLINATPQTDTFEYKLSYHHRQIAAISGSYICQYDKTK